MNKSFLLVCLALLLAGCRQKMKLSPYAVTIPVAGNTFVANGQGNVSDRGIEPWSDPEAVFTLRFMTSHSGPFEMYLQALPADRAATIEITCEERSYILTVDHLEEIIYPVGTVYIKEPGDVLVHIKGISKEGEHFPLISTLIVDGEKVREFPPLPSE